MKRAYKKFVYPLYMFVKDLNGIAPTTALIQKRNYNNSVLLFFKLQIIQGN